VKEERHPPLELDAASDLHYFRLDRTSSERMWKMIQDDHKAVVVWKDITINLSAATFALYMTIPTEKP
jgi:hypothetical protein